MSMRMGLTTLLALGVVSLACDGRAYAVSRCSTAYNIVSEGVLPFLELDDRFNRHCSPEVCAAANDVHCAASAIDAYGRGPMQLGYVNKENWVDARELRLYDAYMRELRRTRAAFGVRHPERIPIYCRMLAGSAALAGTTPHTATTDYDVWALDAVTELALRANRGGHGCSDAVLAAIPHTEEGQYTFHQSAAGHCLTHLNACLRYFVPPIPRHWRAGGAAR